MTRLLLSIFVLLFTTLANAAAPLLSPAELQPLLVNPSVRVIDIRDGAAYGEKHVPGAISAPYGTWRGPASNPGELLSLEKFTARVQSLGLVPDQHVVVVSTGADATDFGAAARVYWTLKVLGFTNLSILNGGIAAWEAAGLAQDNRVPAVAPSTFAPKLDTTLIATREQIASRIDDGSLTLVDARPPAYFSGETRHPAVTLPGTLKGAVNVPHSTWFKAGSATFVSSAEAKSLGSKLAVTNAKESVSFCNTGHWAATDWFARSEILGQKNVKLYPGSMVDWTQSPAPPPMDNVPNRVSQLVIDFRFWVDRTFN